MGSELRGVALLNLGIVETWSGRFDDAERHLSEGAALAQTIGRPYLEVACRAHLGFASKTVFARGRARARPSGGRPGRALWLARSADPRARTRVGWLLRGLDGRIRRGRALAAPCLGRRRARFDPAARCCLHASTGMLHAARGQLNLPLQEFARGQCAGAVAALTGAHVFGTPDCRMARRQCKPRLGMPDEARATLTGFSARGRARARHPHRACSDLHRGGRPTVRRWILLPGRAGRRHPRPAFPRSGSLRRILHAAHRAPATWANRTPPRPRQAALAARGARPADLPVCHDRAAELARPRSRVTKQAHGALLADIARRAARGTAPPSAEGALLPPTEELSPERAARPAVSADESDRGPRSRAELDVSINTVNTPHPPVSIPSSLRAIAPPPVGAHESCGLLPRAPRGIAEGARSLLRSRARSPDSGVARLLGWAGACCVTTRRRRAVRDPDKGRLGPPPPSAFPDHGA